MSWEPTGKSRPFGKTNPGDWVSDLLKPLWFGLDLLCTVIGEELPCACGCQGGASNFSAYRGLWQPLDLVLHPSLHCLIFTILNPGCTCHCVVWIPWWWCQQVGRWGLGWLVKCRCPGADLHETEIAGRRTHMWVATMSPKGTWKIKVVNKKLGRCRSLPGFIDWQFCGILSVDSSHSAPLDVDHLSL